MIHTRESEFFCRPFSNRSLQRDRQAVIIGLVVSVIGMLLIMCAMKMSKRRTVMQNAE